MNVRRYFKNNRILTFFQGWQSPSWPEPVFLAGAGADFLKIMYCMHFLLRIQTRYPNLIVGVGQKLFESATLFLVGTVQHFIKQNNIYLIISRMNLGSFNKLKLLEARYFPESSEEMLSCD